MSSAFSLTMIFPTPSLYFLQFFPVHCFARIFLFVCVFGGFVCLFQYVIQISFTTTKKKPTIIHFYKQQHYNGLLIRREMQTRIHLHVCTGKLECLEEILKLISKLVLEIKKTN